jgi:hypothetical protein
MLNVADTCEVHAWSTTRACSTATNGWVKFHEAMEQGPSKDYNIGVLGAGKGKISDQKTRLVNIWTRAAMALETFKNQHPGCLPPPAYLQAKKQLAKYEATLAAVSKKTLDKKKEGQKLDAVEKTLGLQPSGAASLSARLHHSVNLNIGAKPDAASLFQKGNEEEPIDLDDDGDGATKSEHLSCRHLTLMHQQTTFL